MKISTSTFESKTFTLGDQLTQEQKEYFDKHGVIQFKHFITSETAQLFIDELANIEKQWLAEGIEKVNGIP